MGNIHAQSLLPTLLLMRKITQLTDCQNILLSPINLCDGLAADYAERKFRLSCGHDFTEDILSASRNVAQKYEVDLSHIDTVQTLALQIFDRIKKYTVLENASACFYNSVSFFTAVVPISMHCTQENVPITFFCQRRLSESLIKNVSSLPI